MNSGARVKSRKQQKSLNITTNKIFHHDRNGLITSYFFRFDAMISLLAKVMGLQSHQKQGPQNASAPRT